MTMTISYSSNALSSFAPTPPAFSWWGGVEVHVPAPEVYESWRLADLVPVAPGLWWHRPSNVLALADSAERAMLLAGWESDEVRRWDALPRSMWERKRPWWMIAW